MADGMQSSLLVPDSAVMYITIATMGVLAGVAGGFLVLNTEIVFLNLHAAIWMFLIVWAGSTAYFSYRRVPSGVLAAGLFLLAWLIFLGPFGYYGPFLAEAQNFALNERGQQLRQAFSNLFGWGLAGGVLALTLGGLAMYFRRRRDRILSRRRKRRARRDIDVHGDDHHDRDNGGK